MRKPVHSKKKITKPQVDQFKTDGVRDKTDSALKPKKKREETVHNKGIGEIDNRISQRENLRMKTCN